MTVRDRNHRSPSTGAPSLELERFAWGAPDRLELAGTFSGLDSPPEDSAVLVLAGAERTHRLPAAADDGAGVPENGRPWHAAFVWQEAPAAFSGATLELGPGLVVDLPEPGGDGAAPGNVELAVRVAPADEPVPGPSLERLRLEGELLGAREELQDALAAVRRAEEEQGRARADLHAERDERAADAARFRDGLAQLRASAEEALAAEQDAARQLGDDLKAALGAAAASERELRGELDTAAAVWAESAAASQAEIAALQERVDALSAAGDDADRLRAELAAARSEAGDARRGIEAARDALEAACAHLNVDRQQAG